MNLFHIRGKPKALGFKDKIRAFMLNSKFWEKHIPYCALNSFSVFKDFSDKIGGNIDALSSLTLDSKMWQLLRDLHKLVNQPFPNGHWVRL